SDARRQLADRFELLRVAELGLQIEHLGDVRAIAMHDATGRDGEKGPGNGAALHGHFLAQLTGGTGQALPGDLGRVRRQNGKGMFLAERGGEFLSGLVEVGEIAFGVELEDGIGIDLWKRGELLDLRLGLFAFGDVRETAGRAENAAITIERKLGIDFHPTDFAILGEQARFVAAIVELAFDELEENETITLAVIVMDKLEED